MNKEALTIAVQAALAGDWETSHNIAQDYSDDLNNANIANWIHAVLHKMEGDVWNSKYWYARTGIDGVGGKKYEDFNDVNAELTTILQQLNS